RGEAAGQRGAGPLLAGGQRVVGPDVADPGGPHEERPDDEGDDGEATGGFHGALDRTEGRRRRRSRRQPAGGGAPSSWASIRSMAPRTTDGGGSVASLVGASASARRRSSRARFEWLPA